jgi:hypothetical protein
LKKQQDRQDFLIKGKIYKNTKKQISGGHADEAQEIFHAQYYTAWLHPADPGCYFGMGQPENTGERKYAGTRLPSVRLLIERNYRRNGRAGLQDCCR